LREQIKEHVIVQLDKVRWKISNSKRSWF